jgi:membrane-associated protease RseP (regulator of RpoE activity)
MSKHSFRGALEWALMVAVVLGAGAAAQAQVEDASGGGPVIQIGKGDAEQAGPSSRPGPTDGAIVEEPAAPKYWIGLVGGPIGADHPLRAHVEIPADQGLLAVRVVPDGPAAKAGLKDNDILLTANEIELRDMQDLVELVIAEGEKQGQIAVDVLRRGQRETVFVTPQERPADAARSQGNFGREFGPGFNLPGGIELPQELLEEFAASPFEFRNFGPGVIIGGGDGLANVPDGVSVSINKQAGQPTQITVKRGDETWQVVGDDPESLDKLPKDLRPFVQQMLHGRAVDLKLHGPGRLMPELGEGRLHDRLKQIEEQMQELQKRLMKRDVPADGQTPNASSDIE